MQATNRSGSGGSEGRETPFGRTPGRASGDVRDSTEGEPRIAAFIWGGKTRPTPTLPYGRWRGAA